MSIEELYQYLNEPDRLQETYIVRLSIRGESNQYELVTNEIIYPDPFSPTRWTWENDWYEGGNVKVLGFIPLQEVKVEYYGTKNKR